MTAGRFRALLGAALLVPLLAPLSSSHAAPNARADTAHAQARALDKGDPSWEMLKSYCNDCHNAEDWAGGVAFDTLSPGRIGDDAEIWEAAIKKLRGHLMPPPGKPQPDQKQVEQFVSWMETSLDGNVKVARAGHVPVQRLNRTEYANAVRDLVGVEIKVQDLLPPEIEVDGFDNIAAALSVSPAFLDQYISAARTVARLAVGDAKPKMAAAFYQSPAGAQDSYIDGMPLGSRGGMTFRHNFPSDGEYRFTIKDLDIGLYLWAPESRQTLVMLVDDREVFRNDLGGPEDFAIANKKGASGRAELMKRFQNIPVKVQAGPHQVTVTFIERARVESDEWVEGGTFGRLRLARLLDGIDVSGPYGETSLSRTASREKIFVCEPQSPADEPACARRIAENLARRAYRRPVTAADVDALMPFYDAGRKENTGFDAGVRQLVTAALSSPDFLYRAIKPAASLQVSARNPAQPVPAALTLKPLSDLELASRLSFFLWSQGPDAALLDVAVSGKLRKAGVMQSQVKRMLADKRASALVTGFAMRWLNLDELESVDPDPRLFPEYTVQLRNDFSQEMQLFLSSILLGSESVVGILDGKRTFLNERLARHYGVANVYGPQFRAVTLDDPARFGVLGKGAMLLRTSYGDRTSPVLRGAWVLEKLMGTPPTPPPPNVVTDLSAKPGEVPKTVRARLQLHRTDKTCNQCHGVIDPIGLSLENFDVTGQWRDVDRQAQQPIDASTVLPGGSAVNGPAQLRAHLLERPTQFVQTLTEKLLMYSIGREVEYSDMPQVRAIVRAAAKDDYRLSALVLGIVNSDAFRLQAVPASTMSASTDPEK